MSKPVKYSDLDVNNIVFTKLEDNPRVKAQKIGYIRYKEADGDEDVQLKVQTPEIDSEAYGIPREGPYYPDAKSRAFYKFAFCHERKQYADTVNYDAIETFFNKLVEIDQYCNTDEFRKMIFGDKTYNQYAYQPLVRFPEEEEEDTDAVAAEDKKPSYRPPFTKIKLDLEYSPDPDNVSTKPTFAIFERKDGKRMKVNAETFDDVLKYVRYRAKLRFIISFSKLYAMKTKSGSEKKKYGIILKCTHVESTLPRGSSKAATDEDAFVDSDTDDVITQNVAKITRGGNLDVEDDDTTDVVDESLVQQAIQDATLDSDNEDLVEEPTSKSKKATTKAPAKAGTKAKTAAKLK